MIDEKYLPQLKIIQERLDNECPSPEKDIITLSKMYYDFMKADQKTSRIARIIFEIDEIIRQIRWHYGQALLLLEIYPSIKKYNLNAEENKNKIDDIPATILLGLREFVNYSNQVVFENLESSWFSGTPSGWIFHMMIDNSMIRLISAFDRIALLLFSAADIESNRIYFRSGKMKLLHKKLNLDETKKLYNISSSEAFNHYFLDYRDSLIHTKKQFSRMSGTIPVDAFFQGKEMITNRDFYWDAEILPKLVGAGYKVLTDTLSLAADVVIKIKKDTKMSDAS